jgi:hypothetical protein
MKIPVRERIERERVHPPGGETIAKVNGRCMNRGENPLIEPKPHRKGACSSQFGQFRAEKSDFLAPNRLVLQGMDVGAVCKTVFFHELGSFRGDFMPRKEVFGVS